MTANSAMLWADVPDDQRLVDKAADYWWGPCADHRHPRCGAAVYWVKPAKFMRCSAVCMHGSDVCWQHRKVRSRSRDQLAVLM